MSLRSWTLFSQRVQLHYGFAGKSLTGADHEHDGWGFVRRRQHQSCLILSKTIQTPRPGRKRKFRRKCNAPEKKGGLTPPRSRGNTGGMKTALSIPEDVFEQGERLARRLNTSRSQLYARALADFVVQHEDDKITSSMNDVLREVGAEADGFTRRAARQALRRVEW